MKPHFLISDSLYPIITIKKIEDHNSFTIDGNFNVFCQTDGPKNVKWYKGNNF